MSTIPVCKCGRECTSREAYRGENKGQWYWKCPLNRCGFFQWNDPGPHLYQPIIFTAPPSTTISIQKPNRPSRIEREQQRDQLALHMDDVFHPLGARKSRVVSTQRPKRNRTSETNSTKKTTIQITLYTNTDISVHASERHRYIQTLFRTVKGIVWDKQRHLWLFSADRQMYQRVWVLLSQHRATFDIIGIPLAILDYLPPSTEQFYLQHHQAIATATTAKTSTETTTTSTAAVTTSTAATSSASVTTAIAPIPSGAETTEYIDDHDDEFELGGDDDIIDDGASELPISWFQQEIVRGSKLWQCLNRVQRDAVKKGVKLGRSIYLHDTIGSGRSLQALAMALVYQDDWPVVIVCRASVCQAWKKLIQSMLQLDGRDICLLDHVASYSGKKVYSNSRKAIQSRLYRQRRREYAEQQQAQQNSLSTSSSTDRQQPQNSGDGAEDWCISLKDDGGDGSSYFPGWIEPDKTTSSNGNTFNATAPTPTRKRKRDQLQQPEQQQLCISLKNDSGDVDSDNDDMDDDIYDSGREPDLYDLFGSPDIIKYTSKKISAMDTSSTSAENNGPASVENDNDNNDDEGKYNQAIFDTAKFFIISYDNAKSRLSSLGPDKFKIAIFDDCHDIKNTMMPTYRSALHKFVQGTKKTIMVSSIPVIPKPMETFPLLQIMNPNLFVDYKYFGQRYCDARHLVFGWDYTGTSNEFELRFLLDRTLLVP